MAAELVRVFPEDLVVKMYREMVLARVFDGMMVKLQRIGKVAAYTSSEGQEAVGVGAVNAVKDDDWIFPTYRETGAYVARGVPLEILAARQLATSLDPLKGHEVLLFGDRRYRIITGPGPVAAHLCTSTGFSLASKLKNDSSIALVFFGDGATSKGDFHEGLNFAGVFKTPTVFICQNNQYAISQHVSKQTAAETIADKAVAYGFEGVRIDGNNVLAVYDAVSRAAEKARGGDGPTLVEALTYRLAAHSTADDPSRYRDGEEVEKWRRHDPLHVCRKMLEEKGLWNEDRERELWSSLTSLVSQKVEIAEKAQPLHPSTIFDDVYSRNPWHLEEELEDFEA
ncbi:MAG: thiamine pyrophosphate-dependent enzyme [Candidatus Caldarchaeum sp.]